MLRKLGEDSTSFPSLRSKRRGSLYLAFLVFICVVFSVAYFNRATLQRLKKITDHYAQIYQAENLFYKSIGEDETTLVKEEPHIGYTIHLGTFSKKEPAMALVEHLRKEGVNSFYSPVQRGAEVLFHVRSGVYQNQKVALDRATALRKKNFDPQVVILQ